MRKMLGQVFLVLGLRFRMADKIVKKARPPGIRMRKKMKSPQIPELATLRNPSLSCFTSGWTRDREVRSATSLIISLNAHLKEKLPGVLGHCQSRSP